MIRQYTEYCKPGLGKLLSAFGLDVTYVRAKGDYLWYFDSDGRERKVIDFIGSYGATLLGHNPPALTRAFRECLESNPPHFVQASVRPGAAILANKLNQIARKNLGGDYVTSFFSTGTEAVEAALKLLILQKRNQLRDETNEILVSAAAVLRSRGQAPFAFSVEKFPAFHGKKWASVQDAISALDEFNQRVARQPFPLIAFENAYHGKTLGSLSLTYNERFRDPFRQHLGRVHFIPHSEKELRELVAKTTVSLAELRFDDGKFQVVPRETSPIMGIMFEPVLGEGGALPLSTTFVQKLFQIARIARIPVAADEIQSGMGRCGTFFALEPYSTPAPDLVMLSKFLGGGLAKLSALMSRREITDDEFTIIHTSTFAEDEISCRIGSRVVNTLLAGNEKVLRQCRDLGKKILKKLTPLVKKFPGVLKEIRGRGLLIGIEFQDLTDSGSNLLRFICTQGDFGYFIASFLLHEFDIRVAPGLNAKRTIRIEPSVFLKDSDLDQLFKSLVRLCEILQHRDTYLLSRFLLPENPPSGNKKEKIRSAIRNPDQFMQPEPTEPNRVAFLGHFIDPTFLAGHEPSFSRFSEDQLRRIIERTYRHIDPCLFVNRDITSKTGQKVNFNFVGMSVTSKIIKDHLQNRDLGIIRDQIRTGVHIARDRGCRLVGFGQFTSIVTRNCQALVVPGMAFTSGNTLTIGMAFQAVQETLQKKHRPWRDVTCGILGGGGNIGSTFAQLLGDKVPKIVLIGGLGNDSHGRLEKTAVHIILDQLENSGNPKTLSPIGENLLWLTRKLGIRKSDFSPSSPHAEMVGLQILQEIHRLPIQNQFVRIGSLAELPACDVVITATNTTTPFVLPSHLAREVIVCDVSIPSALTPGAVKRAGVEAFKGGVVALPHLETLNIGALPLEPGFVYACMAETILLGLERRWEDFSLGNVEKRKVIEILNIANRHGFKLARLKCEDSVSFS